MSFIGRFWKHGKAEQTLRLLAWPLIRPCRGTIRCVVKMDDHLAWPLIRPCRGTFSRKGRREGCRKGMGKLPQGEKEN
jgi:hypothetical protein